MILKQAIFCRCRHCTTCQWRRSLLWKAMMYQTYDKLREQYPTHRFVFLTLTVKNCEIGELRSTLQHMNKSWQRLKDRKRIYGWCWGLNTYNRNHPPQKDPKDKNKKNKRVCPVTGNTMHTLTSTYSWWSSRLIFQVRRISKKSSMGWTVGGLSACWLLATGWRSPCKT